MSLKTISDIGGGVALAGALLLTTLMLIAWRSRPLSALPTARGDVRFYAWLDYLPPAVAGDLRPRLEQLMQAPAAESDRALAAILALNHPRSASEYDAWLPRRQVAYITELCSCLHADALVVLNRLEAGKSTLSTRSIESIGKR